MSDKVCFNGSIVIADPCYFMNSDEDWEKCGYGEHMNELGFTDFMRIDFPDDPKRVINKATGKLIGEFCQDSGVIVIVYKDELQAYNPDYEKSFGSNSNRTIIEGFNGKISFNVEEVTDEEGYEDIDTNIVGDGNISFETVNIEDEKDDGFVPNLEMQSALNDIISSKLSEMGIQNRRK
ncbi:hypothetical protein [Butyrivibrio sp. MC2013]|uniref:hypothetical protein n=1 Tax=Butyrivibrio sp. MC2013 TaxID=1280686 RepID=UPI0004052323|nr:hypothetical protein [Butyrivibrio sp. MC2013]